MYYSIYIYFQIVCNTQIVFYVYYGLLCLQLCVHCWAEKDKSLKTGGEVWR